MTTDRLRTSLAAVALAASVSVAGVASAHEGKGPGHGGGKSKPCKAKGKGYEVQGTFAWADLEQVAGAGTARTNDDRFSGTVVADVEQGNRRGRRDLGRSAYTVTGVRVIGAAADGTLPAAGTRVELVGKQLTAKQARTCAPAPTTPAPTTPAPTTPTDPDPDPTATPAAARPDRSGGPKVEQPALDDESDDVVTAEDDTPDHASTDDAPQAGDDIVASGDRRHGRPKASDDTVRDEDGTAKEDDAADDDTTVDDEPTAVTDVAIRVVHFKARSKAARR